MRDRRLGARGPSGEIATHDAYISHSARLEWPVSEGILSVQKAVTCAPQSWTGASRNPSRWGGYRDIRAKPSLLSAGDCGQVQAYPLRPRLPDMQPARIARTEGTRAAASSSANTRSAPVPS
jgi:hypothetical protein